MKKSLVAAALMSCFAGAALAAPTVNVYGLIDTGLSYVHTNADVAGTASTDTFSMENGQEFGSRWGIKGSEKLGSSTVSFVLESGFQSDDGASDTKQAGRLFGREASVTVTGPYGSVAFGRLPIFGSVLSANGLFRAIDPSFANYTVGMGSGYATASMWTRVDNAISYRTPTFAGLTGYAMYSFKNDSTNTEGVEGKSSADRYASLALRYQNGAFEGVLVSDYTLYGNKDHPNADDGFTVTLGGNYTFSNQLKVLAFAQYFDKMFLNVNARGGVATNGILAITDNAGYGQVDGWGVGLGVNYPVWGGTAKAGLNYRDMSNQTDVDFTRVTGTVAYDYPFSKRTSVYGMAGYSQEKVKASGKSATPNGCQISVGMLHRF